MSDTPTAGEAATKTRMLNSFLDNVKTNIQNSIVWDTGSRPADGTSQTIQTAIPGAITTGKSWRKYSCYSTRKRNIRGTRN